MSNKPNPRRSNGHRRDQIRARIKAQGMPCAICGQPIDYSAPYRLRDGSINPYSYVVDEIVPVSKGGDPLDIRNCQPAHYRCNAKRGDRMISEPQKMGEEIPHSREW